MAQKSGAAGVRGSREGIVEALNHEWLRLDQEHGDRGIVATWAGRHTALTGCRSIIEVLDAVRADSDASLHALLTEVSKGDQLAGRVVLQSMVGRLVRMAHRDVRAGVDDYVAAMWCEIIKYPLERRPVKIASNLALDTLKAVLREHRWLVRGEVTTWPPGELLDELFDGLHSRAAHTTNTPSVGAEGVLAAAHRLNVIDVRARKILTSVYVDGLSGIEAAHRHGTSPGSIRVGCNRAIRRMSLALPVLLEVV